LNAVDTGWVTDEDPAELAKRNRAGRFQPPLDIVDGAASWTLAMVLTQGKTHWCSKILKDNPTNGNTLGLLFIKQIFYVQL
jgi:hypothetical protein